MATWEQQGETIVLRGDNADYHIYYHDGGYNILRAWGTDWDTGAYAHEDYFGPFATLAEAQAWSRTDDRNESRWQDRDTYRV